jgi:hypothetical protein
MVNIVGTDNEADLLQKTCDQFIADRQHLLTWMGFNQEDSQISCLFARARRGADYLSSVRIT